MNFSQICCAALANAVIRFSDPLPFSEALQSRDVRSILPTDLSSEELRAAMEPSIMQHATFSARVTNYEYLQEIDDVTRRVVNGEIDMATARTQLKVKLREIGYEPDPKDRGKITDFGSEARLRVVLETNVRIAQGYGQFMQGLNPGVLDAFPAQELFRLSARKKERNWKSRWKEAGGKLSGGRMIARKDSPIWLALGSIFPDSLGHPYPPFAFSSGMWVKDVSRDDAMKFGLIDRDTQVKPEDPGLNDALRFTPKQRSAALNQALEESIGPLFKMEDGVLKRINIMPGGR